MCVQQAQDNKQQKGLLRDPAWYDSHLLKAAGCCGLCTALLLACSPAVLIHACSFPSRKNFFKFRLSPIVSGAVYVSYMAFLISVIDKEVRRSSLCCCGREVFRQHRPPPLLGNSTAHWVLASYSGAECLAASAQTNKVPALPDALSLWHGSFVSHQQVRQVPAITGRKKEGWPSVWRYSVGGRVGLALLGIAFTIATCIQLQGVLTQQWHRDYRCGPATVLLVSVHLHCQLKRVCFHLPSRMRLVLPVARQVCTRAFTQCGSGRQWVSTQMPQAAGR